MGITSLIFSVIAIGGFVFLLLERIGIIRIVKDKNFKQYFRDAPDALMNKQQNQPEAQKKSVFRGT